MKILLWIGFLGLLVHSVLAWTKEDHEIFDLVSALEASEGKGTTFYSWLDVSPSASSKEIARAYRKKSIVLHPDKNPGVKGAHERFARLGTISQILRNKEGRERYDFFYKNGVPRWRGTGYYYSRYRPGLGSVTVFLILVSSGMHYIIQRVNYKNDLARIDRFVREARLAAWGPRMVPLEGRRKVRVSLGGRAYMDEEGNVVSGKQVEMIVEGDDVFILESDGSLLPLHEGAASPPSVKRTWFISLILSFLGRKQEDTQDQAETQTSSEAEESQASAGNRKQRRKARKAAAAASEGATETSGTDDISSGAVTPVQTSTGRAGRPTTMAGGRRRKGVPRKVPERKPKDKDNEGKSEAL